MNNGQWLMIADGVLREMLPIGLDDMKTVRLMNRVEQKYIASADLLETLLARIANHYYVQQTPNGNASGLSGLGDAARRVSTYRTLYFDTDDLQMYTMHHNEKPNRQKLRVRCYRSTNTTYFEIKNKDCKHNTRKVRLPIDASMFDRAWDVPEVRDFVSKNTPYNFNYNACIAGLEHSRINSSKEPSTSNSIHPCLENSFERITLVDKRLSERVTIDSDIRFFNRATGLLADTGKLLVIEVKHNWGAPMSEIEKALHELHILPRRMSKYCIGTALTDTSVKHNRFKSKLLYIEKLMVSD